MQNGIICLFFGVRYGVCNTHDMSPRNVQVDWAEVGILCYYSKINVRSELVGFFTHFNVTIVKCIYS